MTVRTAVYGMIGALAVSFSMGLPSFDALAQGASPAARQTPAPEAKAKAKARKPAKAKALSPKTRSSQLDLSVRDLPEKKPLSPEDPNYMASALSGGGSSDPDAGTTPAERSAAAYRTEPLFQSDQKLQILDAEVPVSVKLGKWKTSEESKALGLSATVPLRVLD